MYVRRRQNFEFQISIVTVFRVYLERLYYQNSRSESLFSINLNEMYNILKTKLSS